MNKIVKVLKFLFFIFTLFIGFFIFGCTLPTSKKVEDFTKLSNGLLISNVYYQKEIAENSNLKIDVELKNKGFDSNNVKITLLGLTDKWTPSPPILQSLNIIKSEEVKNITFIVKSPEIFENRTDSFGFKIEYNYTSVYEAKLRLEKDEYGNVSLKIESEKLLKPAPIDIKLSKFKILENRVAFLNFSITNIGTGKLIQNQLIITDGISCERSEILKEKQLSCKIDIPSFEKLKIIEIYLKLLYIYEYQIDLIYKVKVYNLQ